MARTAEISFGLGVFEGEIGVDLKSMWWWWWSGGLRREVEEKEEDPAPMVVMAAIVDRRTEDGECYCIILVADGNIRRMKCRSHHAPRVWNLIIGHVATNSFLF